MEHTIAEHNLPSSRSDHGNSRIYEADPYCEFNYFSKLSAWGGKPDIQQPCEILTSLYAIDSKLRGCDLVKLRVCDVMQGNRMMSRAMAMQQKTQRPVQFEITEQTRDTVTAWLTQAQLKADEYLFPSRVHASSHISTRQ